MSLVEIPQIYEELVNMPDHLRRTVVSLDLLGGIATADMIAEQTGRARAVESSYLNQLAVQGKIDKYRRGRKVYFSKIITVPTFADLLAETTKLKVDLQRILLEDLRTAFQNRLEVLKRAES